LRKILKGVALTCLLLLVLAGAIVGLIKWHFYPSPPELPTAKANSELDAQRQDLAYFNKLIALDRAFSPAARAAADRRIAELQALPAPLDHAHWRVALMQITTLADNAHTSVGSDTGALPRELPVRVAIFPEGAYVMRAKDAAADLLGGRIVAIDDTPIDIVLARLKTLRGGLPQWREIYASRYITYQDLLHGLDIAPDADRSSWAVITPEGASLTRTLEAAEVSADRPDPFPKRWLSSEPLAGLTEGWQVYQPAASPTTLQDFDTTFRTSVLADGCTRFVQYKSNDDDGDQSIGEFTARLRETLQAQPPCALIMDLRYDDGGNYVKTARFMRHVADYTAPGAPIYLLTGPFTFSAGLVSAAFIEYTGGERVTVIGASVGDRPQFFAEGGSGCLPNYPLCVNYATGKHDYQKFCGHLRDCFWVNYMFPTHVVSFAPEIPLETSFEDWHQGRDPAYERAIELARQQAVPTQGPTQGQSAAGQ
jgi:hypothetical protein